MKKNDLCYLYVVAVAGDSGPVKIGISRDPENRLNGLQTASPLLLYSVHTFKFPQRDIATYIEANIHQHLADRRGIGEWFNIAPIEALFEVVQFICAIIEVHLEHTGADNVLLCKRLCGIPEADKKIIAFLSKLHPELYGAPVQ